MWREGREPQLHPQVLYVDPSYRTFPRHARLVIHNAGQGLAKGVGFVLCEKGEWAAGNVGDGFLLPGQTRNVDIDMTPTEPTQAVVICRDAEENTYAWDAAGHRWRIPRRDRYGREKDSVLSAKDFVRYFYPTIDTAALEARAYKVLPAEG